jgi:DNA-binding NarL/FixJ family response regulator
MMHPRGISVLVVEDDQSFRSAFSQAIEGADGLFLAGTAATFGEGQSLLARTKPDVLLVDLGLPDGNGIDLIRLASETLPDCEVMVTTVFGDERHVIASIEAGASGYLLKDSSPGDVADQIRMLHAGGSPISPVIARGLLSRFQSAPAAPLPESRNEPRLSERELEVLGLITKGFTFDEISRLLAVSAHTVSTYVKRIYGKLRVRSKTEAVYEARKLGLVDD